MWKYRHKSVGVSTRWLRLVAVVGLLVGSLTLVVPSLVQRASAQGCTPGSIYSTPGTVILPGSCWMGGQGVDVKSDGGSGQGGYWQCVELVTNLYDSKGWGTGSWPYANGDQIWATHRAGLTSQAQGSITYLNPGDAVSMEVIQPNGVPEYGGHVAVVSSVNGSQVTLVQQNAVSVVTTATFSGGRITLPGSGSYSYPVTGVLHAPSTTNGSAGASRSGYEIAVQANTGQLWNVGSDANGASNLGLMPGTSPSITPVPGGYEMAFQANTGQLWVAGTAGTGNTGYGMAGGTSPSITTLANGTYEVAFQANTGNLWAVGGIPQGGYNLGMMQGTSPSITSAGSGFEIAVQANTGQLWLAGSQGSGATSYGMAGGTSPSITETSSGYEVAFQANTGNLWAVGGIPQGGYNLGMMQGTNPSIVGVS